MNLSWCLGVCVYTKTARIYAENGALTASMLRAMALSQDATDVWGLLRPCQYFDEVEWPDALVRTLYMNLLDNLVGGGPVNAAEKVHQDATEWATARQDKDMIAWLCFAGLSSIRGAKTFIERRTAQRMRQALRCP